MLTWGRATWWVGTGNDMSVTKLGRKLRENQWASIEREGQTEAFAVASISILLNQC